MDMDKISNKNKREIDWINTIFLTTTPFLAIYFSYNFFTTNERTWPLILLAIFFYYLTGMSITGGYHRLFSHRAYKANPLLKLIYLLFGAATFQNSALKWSTDHRIHHTHVDRESDPYNINKGFFWAHIGWIFFKDPKNYHQQFPADLTNDKLVMWQHRYYFLIAISTGFILPTILGYILGSALGGFALAGLMRIVAVHHCTFFINSLCHIIGRRPYTESNTARDSYIMAIFSYGEGYHNYHHFFPTDYRNGIRWYHFDPTKWMIRLASFIGLAKELRRVPERAINEARFKMQQKRGVYNM